VPVGELSFANTTTVSKGNLTTIMFVYRDNVNANLVCSSSSPQRVLTPSQDMLYLPVSPVSVQTMQWDVLLMRKGRYIDIRSSSQCRVRRAATPSAWTASRRPSATLHNVRSIAHHYARMTLSLLIPSFETSVCSGAVTRILGRY